MIVTGKRCFLNVLTQLWPAERLLKANYYVGDRKSPNARAHVSEQLLYDEYGQIKRVNNQTESFATMYNIKYNNCLDPTPHSAEYVMGHNVDDYSTPEERFINNHLNNPTTLIAVYNFLFKDQLQDSNIQILMFEDDMMLWRFGHIICQYLSVNFGVDIVFIDPQYNPNCRGFANYQGDKERGKELVIKIRNSDMLLKFEEAITSSEYYGSLSNLTQHLLGYDAESIMLLYSLLFPDDPLPPGNYTMDYIREIIIDRCSRSICTTRSVPSNMNLLNWDTVISRINQEYIDYYDDDNYGGSDTGIY